MKKIKAISLFLLSLLFFITLTACDNGEKSENDESSDGTNYVYRLSENGEITITRYKSNEEIVKIPATINGRPVTAIAEKAFFRNVTAKEVIVPSGVTTIGVSAFEACPSLSKITIPKTVTALGDMAFNGCSMLEKIDIESGSALKEIGKNAFSNCRLLKTAEYENTFYLPAGNIEHAILISVSSTEITEAQIHPDTKIITANAFSKCSSLEEITIPENIEYIGDEAFYGCTKLDMIYFNAKNVHDLLPGSAVFQLAATTSVTMTMQVGPKVERIPAYLFDSAPRFTILRFDDGSICSGIGQGAFAGTDLKEVVIPASMRVIEDFAFSDCKWLQTVRIDAENLSDFAEGNKIFNDSGSKADNGIFIIFGRSAKRVPAYFCKSISNVTSVKFENNDVTNSFGKNAFINCKSIQSVRVSSRKGWCESTFENEKSNPLYYGNAYLYVNDKSVTEGFVITEDIAYISDYAFVGYRNMEKMIIPKTVKYIGVNAFYGVENLDVIYWSGDQESWSALEIKAGNDKVKTSNIFYYWPKVDGGDRPTTPGNYWYLDQEEGTPVKWLTISVN